MSETLELRHAYPGVPPWAWDEHPFEKARVLTVLRAYDGARAMLKQQQADHPPT